MRLTPWPFVCLACMSFWVAAIQASDRPRPLQSAAERWAKPDPAAVPEFARHVVPVLGRLGCNSRACHGSFQGQNGFRLSLFGHDLNMDLNELTADEGDGPRVDLKHPAKSLALRKPTNQEEHGGGQRMEAGSWQYNLLQGWIASGAGFDRKRDSKLLQVEVQPHEFRLTSGEHRSLRVLATFSDGTQEDVTCMTVFSSNNDAVARVDESGGVSFVSSGDTAIVATYAGVVETSQIIAPQVTEIPFPAYPPNNKIDEFVADKLRKVNLRPSELCGDEAFLRRAFVDLIGTLPTADEAREFLQDADPRKRAKLIDVLLERPEYALYWATRFSDWTGNDNRFTPVPRAKTGWLWYEWLRDKLARNVPYDEIVGGFITATTREGRPLKEVAAEYKQINKNLRSGFDQEVYARRKTNTIFWEKATNRSASTAALQTAYAFLGVRLECAQCHKHPFDRWTRDDFQSFTSFFSVVSRGAQGDVPKALKKKGSKQEYSFNEVFVSLDKKSLARLNKQPPKLLGGDVVECRKGDDPREALFAWMRSPDNPYLAPAIANRLWGHYFGVGVVDPVDDFNAANPPSNPDLLHWLADDFIRHKFDLKHLHRRILNSRTYQLSWRPNDSNKLDERNFSHALLRRMPAEVVLDAINQVTGGKDAYSRANAPPNTRAIGLAPSRLRGGGPEYVLGIFGRPIRTQLCDCERSGETGLSQAMYLLNDVELNAKISDPKGRLARTLKKLPRDEDLVEELYLSALSRFPRPDETQKAVAFIARAKQRQIGSQDLLWSLINLREFIFVH